MILRIIQSLLLVVLAIVVSQNMPIERNRLVHASFSCCTNDGTSNNRKYLLSLFMSTLQSLAPNYKGPDGNGFFLNERCQLPGVLIFDLTDSVNKEKPGRQCMRFLKNHVYLFTCSEYHLAYRNVAVLTDSVRIFRAINCPEFGDKITSVTAYVARTIPDYVGNEMLVKQLNSAQFGPRREDPQDQFVCKYTY